MFPFIEFDFIFLGKVVRIFSIFFGSFPKNIFVVYYILNFTLYNKIYKSIMYLLLKESFLLDIIRFNIQFIYNVE